MKRRGDRSVAVNPASNVWRRVGAERTLPPSPPPPANLKERVGREGKGKEERKGKKKKRKKKVRGDQLATKCKSGGGGGTGVLIEEGARGK